MGKKLKILVSSSVHGFETELDQIYAMLSAYGYEVLMSHKGTINVPPHVSNEQACLKAVEDCDIFLGLVRPLYSSGITHSEIKHAVNLDKARWFLAHAYVPFAREILKQYMYKKDGTIKPSFRFKKTGVMDNIKVIDMYNDAIQHSLPRTNRKCHWAQPFYTIGDIFTFIDYQFKNTKKMKAQL